jgi:hypothetical protein
MAGRYTDGARGAGHPPAPRQRGAALLIFLVLLVMAGLTYVLNSFSPEAIQARRLQLNDAVLQQAQEALLGYALKFREEQLKDGQTGQAYGYLPLPDLGSTRNNNPGCTQEGCDAADFAGNGANISVIGRLPWRALGIPPLRDGHGECLWYAVSGSHQRIHQASPLNWDTPGHFDIVIANGTAALASALANAHARPVAVIFSPGPPWRGKTAAPPPAMPSANAAATMWPATTSTPAASPSTAARTIFPAAPMPPAATPPPAPSG